MDKNTIQILFCTCIGLISTFGIYRLARRGLLSFRYTVGWLVLSTTGVVAGVALPIIAPLARFLAITPAALLAIGGVLLLVIICLQLSISISGLHERQRRLTEELAHLRLSVDNLERSNQK
jgi:uncharacterized membrane protein YfcA